MIISLLNIKNLAKVVFFEPVKKALSSIGSHIPNMRLTPTLDLAITDQTGALAGAWLHRYGDPSSAIREESLQSFLNFFFQVGQSHALNVVADRRRAFFSDILFISGLCGVGIAAGVLIARNVNFFKIARNLNFFKKKQNVPSPKKLTPCSFLNDLFGSVESGYKSTQLAVGTAISQMPFWQFALFSTLGLVILGVSVIVYNQRKKTHEKQKALLESTLFDDVNVSALNVLNTN